MLLPLAPHVRGKAFTAVHTVMCPFHFLALEVSVVGLDVGNLKWLKLQGGYAHRKSVGPIRPQASIKMFLESPLKCPPLWCQPLLLLSHSMGCVTQKWGGGLLLFSLYTQKAAFLPLFYLPVFQIIPLICVFCTSSRGPCHFKKNSLSLYSGYPVGGSPETQYYLAIGIMVGKVLVGSYVKHLENDLVALKNLKLGILG